MAGFSRPFRFRRGGANACVLSRPPIRFSDSRDRSRERRTPRGMSTFLLKAREEGKTARRRRGVFSLKDTHSLSGLRGASRRAVSGVFRRPAALSSEVQALSRGASASSVSRLPAGVHSNPGRSPNAARVRGLRQPHPRAPLRPKARISRAPGHRGCGPYLRPAPRSVPPPRRLMKASPRRTRWERLYQTINPISRKKYRPPDTVLTPRVPDQPRLCAAPIRDPGFLQRAGFSRQQPGSRVCGAPLRERMPRSLHAAPRTGKALGWRSCRT